MCVLHVYIFPVRFLSPNVARLTLGVAVPAEAYRRRAKLRTVLLAEVRAADQSKAVADQTGEAVYPRTEKSSVALV